MIVDTSAVIAMLFDESGANAISNQLLRGSPKMSAATLVELQVVALRRLPATLRRNVQSLLDTFAIEIVPFTAEHARIAGDALRDFGRGSGHPAQLNLGDAYSYALASATGEPLLFVGDDFTHTDLVPAILTKEPT